MNFTVNKLKKWKCRLYCHTVKVYEITVKAKDAEAAYEKARRESEGEGVYDSGNLQGESGHVDVSVDELVKEGVGS